MIRHNGFTLIELLVVIAIIALLVSMLVPSLRMAKELAKTVACANNERNILIALGSFASDHNGLLPVATWTNPTTPFSPPHGGPAWKWTDFLAYGQYLTVGFQPSDPLHSWYPYSCGINWVTHFSDSKMGVLRCPAWRNDPRPSLWGPTPYTGYGNIVGRWYYYPGGAHHVSYKVRLADLPWDKNGGYWTVLAEGKSSMQVTNLWEVFPMRHRHNAHSQYDNFGFSDGHVEVHPYDIYDKSNPNRMTLP